MHAELADDIVRISAPIYAALLLRLIEDYPDASVHIPVAVLEAARREAIAQAIALRKQVIEWPAC